LTPAASLAEVIAGSGNRLWQDRANHLVWFKVQGGLGFPNLLRVGADSDEALYQALSVVLQGS
jgi:hypothetical protein